MCNGRTSWETFLAGKEIIKKKILSGNITREVKEERILHQDGKNMELGSDLTDPGSKDELSDQIVTFTNHYLNTE